MEILISKSDVLEVCQAITDEKNELIEFLDKS